MKLWRKVMDQRLLACLSRIEFQKLVIIDETTYQGAVGLERKVVAKERYVEYFVVF